MTRLNRKELPMNKLTKQLADSIRRPMPPPSRQHGTVKGKGSYRRVSIKSWSKDS